MIILLSPAKTLDFETPSPLELCTEPDFLPLSKDLISGLAKLSSEEIGALMGISPKLAELNRERYQSWRFKHDSKSSKQAILAFKGDALRRFAGMEFQEGRF